MDSRLFAKLAALPRLSDSHARALAIPCKICGSSAEFFDVVDFNKAAGSAYKFGLAGVSVLWHRCISCGYLFTAFFDDWTPEEFARFIYNSDYLKVDPDYAGARAARLLDEMPALLGPAKGMRLLDYGSGAGKFVRGLIERGFAASGYDPFSSPDRPTGRFDLITCFEVIEHSPDPIGLLRDMASLLAPGGGIILGQTLQPANIEELRCSWWYCGPRNGHCSTFTERALIYAADLLGMHFHRGPGRHAFTARDGGPVSELLASVTGPPLTSLRLGAPGNTQVPGWHGIEHPATGPFRWTAQASVSWRAALPRGFDVHVPVCNAIYPDFLKRCRIRIEGRQVETKISNGGLVGCAGNLESIAGPVDIELQTPPPQSPRKLRGVPDDRPLGLAVPVLG